MENKGGQDSWSLTEGLNEVGMRPSERIRVLARQEDKPTCLINM